MAEALMAERYFALVGYGHAVSPNTDYSITRRVKLGTAVRGYDSFRSIEDLYYRNYYIMETGQISLAEEGKKAFVKELWLRTYAPSNLLTPIALIQVMDQHGNWWRDWRSVSSLTMTSSSCVADSPFIVSNKLITSDGVTTTYTVPVRAKKIHTVTAGAVDGRRIGFSVSGDYEITLWSTVLPGIDIFIFWHGEPQASQITYGDYVESPEGLHAIRGFQDYQTLLLNWYPQNDCTGYMRIGRVIPAGDAKEVLFPLNQTLYTPKFRIILVPRDSTVSGPEIKITGLNFVYEIEE